MPVAIGRICLLLSGVTPSQYPGSTTDLILHTPTQRDNDCAGERNGQQKNFSSHSERRRPFLCPVQIGGCMGELQWEWNWYGIGTMIIVMSVQYHYTITLPGVVVPLLRYHPQPPTVAYSTSFNGQTEAELCRVRKRSRPGRFIAPHVRLDCVECASDDELCDWFGDTFYPSLMTGRAASMHGRHGRSSVEQFRRRRTG